MDVNVLRAQEAGFSGATSLVAHTPAADLPKPPPDVPKVSTPIDIVEISLEHQKPVTNTALDNRKENRSRSTSNIYHDDITNQFVVEIFNANNEKIRQIPREDVLKIAARFKEVTGMLFDQQV